LVEQRFCKPLVVGSIPTAGTGVASKDRRVAFRHPTNSNDRVGTNTALRLSRRTEQLRRGRFRATRFRRGMMD